MVISRSAIEFQQRHGLVSATLQPASRLAVEDLLVHFLPLHPPNPQPSVLRPFEIPPDRGTSRPWPS